MDVYFGASDLARCYERSRIAIRTWGDQGGRRYIQRINELKAAPTLADLRRLPQVRLHALTGDRDDQFAVDVEHPKRIILEPYGEPESYLGPSGIDENKVTAITVIEVLDYHGRSRKR